MGPDVELGTVARGTPGFSGADLENLCNEAALLAARRDGEQVTKLDFEMAKDKLLMGSERRSLTLSDTERRVTAYHEAGHALVALMEEDCDPLHKVSIVPRGQALGVTMTLPAEDRFLATKKQLLALIRHAMGGRAAEEVVFQQFSSGASDDLSKATDIARKMVCSYGMSEKIGPIFIEDPSPNVFLGRELGSGVKHSPEMARAIDAEIQSILTAAYERAQYWLTEKRSLLDSIAASLLERETLDARELQILLEGGELPLLAAPSADASVTPPMPTEQGTEAPDEPRFGDETIPEPEPVPG